MRRLDAQSSRRRSTSWPRATATCCRSCSPGSRPPTRRRRTRRPHSTSTNYRSRPEVLAVVNHLFGGDFGDEFQRLAASGEFPDPVFGPPVELLVTDKSSYAEDEKIHWRRAEAKAIARRIRELLDAGAATAGE